MARRAGGGQAPCGPQSRGGQAPCGPTTLPEQGGPRFWQGGPGPPGPLHATGLPNLNPKPNPNPNLSPWTILTVNILSVNILSWTFWRWTFCLWTFCRDTVQNFKMVQNIGVFVCFVWFWKWMLIVDWNNSAPLFLAHPTPQIKLGGPSRYTAQG